MNSKWDDGKKCSTRGNQICSRIGYSTVIFPGSQNATYAIIISSVPPSRLLLAARSCWQPSHQPKEPRLFPSMAFDKPAPQGNLQLICSSGVSYCKMGTTDQPQALTGKGLASFSEIQGRCHMGTTSAEYSHMWLLNHQ